MSIAGLSDQATQSANASARQQRLPLFACPLSFSAQRRGFPSIVDGNGHQPTDRTICHVDFLIHSMYLWRKGRGEIKMALFLRSYAVCDLSLAVHPTFRVLGWRGSNTLCLIAHTMDTKKACITISSPLNFVGISFFPRARGEDSARRRSASM